jgi:hypothetical protein
VICGAVVAGLLEKVAPDLTTLTTIGTSPAPANDSGIVKVSRSNPGISRFGPTKRIEAPLIAVVPTVTVTSPGCALRTPVKVTSSTVATNSLPTRVFTWKGSPVLTKGFVTLNTVALPPASPVEEKMSGCAGTIVMKLRNILPLLLMTTVAVPGGKLIGTTKFIWFGELPTKYKPAAAPLTETDTPFSSTGRKGDRDISDPPLAVTLEGAKSSEPFLIIANSPAAKPAASVAGVGLGDGLGVGVGLGLGVGLTVGTGNMLAPVKNCNATDDELFTSGVRR